MAVISRWFRPKTVDDYLEDVQYDVWWGRKDLAIRTLMWLMETQIKESENGRKEEVICATGTEAGEDGSSA